MSQLKHSTDAILASDTGGDTIIYRLATRARDMELLAMSLMGVCYDEANRLANHGSNGLEKQVMLNLYGAARAAKEKLNA